jgi:hypothetical protein
MRDATWFARQLGDGWTDAGDGIYFPPEPQPDAPEPALAVGPDPVAAERSEPYRLRRRRGELVRLRDRLVERVSRFPNAVAERQLREIENELGALARRLRPFPAARQS